MDVRDIVHHMIVLAGIALVLVLGFWLMTGCREAASAAELAQHAAEAGAPFDQAMIDCESDARTLDAGQCDYYNACQRRVALQYGLPLIGSCPDGGVP